MDLWLASWLASKSFNSRQQTDLWQLVCISCGYLPIVSYDQLLGLMPQQAYVPCLMLLPVTCGVVQWSAAGLYMCNASNWQSEDGITSNWQSEQSGAEQSMKYQISCLQDRWKIAFFVLCNDNNKLHKKLIGVNST